MAGFTLFTAFVMLVGIYFYTSHVQRSITKQERRVSKLYISWIDLKEELYQSSYGPSSYSQLLTKLSRFETILQKNFLSDELFAAKLRVEELETTLHALYIKWPFVLRDVHSLINKLALAKHTEFPSLFSPTLLMRSFEQDLIRLDETIRAYSLEQLNRFQLFNNLILTTLVLLLLGFLMFLLSSRQKHIAEERIRMLTQSLLRMQEDERKQISYDLHDDIVQDLASMKMNIDNMVYTFDNSKGVPISELSSISSMMQEIIQATRRISGEIRPYNLDHIGLVGAVRGLCNNLAVQTGSQVRFFPVGVNSLQSDYTTEINLYRITQEALQNIRKHSTATKISVRLIASSPHLLLRIQDNGRGFNPSHGFAQANQTETHLGLTSMEERTKMLNGEFSISSSLGRGTEIKVKVPMQYQTTM
ncbi:MAG: sensor histidine kinase [Spirochaetia bacterium]|nr:sensor histidine kinase [Spirochaetia bacterium]